MPFNSILIDRVHRIPRIWSNQELKKHAQLFEGSVVNVSAYQDEDKEGDCYKNYFHQAKSYTLTNYNGEKGLQGRPGELELDLASALPETFKNAFDVVFNHTTLEHIYDFKKAFHNLCNMSRDVVILIVPFLQPYHTNYGDFWRFSPECIVRLFSEQAFETLYLSWNTQRNASIYVYAIATRNPVKWKTHFDSENNIQKGVPGQNTLFNEGYQLRKKYFRKK